MLLLCALALSPAAARAHPVPKLEYDRNLTVELTPSAVRVAYRLEIDQYTLYHDVGRNDSGFPLDRSRKLSRQDFADAFIARMKTVIPDQIDASLGGKPLTFTCESARCDFADSAQFHFRLRADWKPQAGKNRFEVRELNFPDKRGRLKMSLDADATLKVLELSEPVERTIPGTDEAARHTITAVFEAPGTPPNAPAPTQPEPAPEETPPAPPSAATSFSDLWNRLETEGLVALLGSDRWLVLVMLIAALHGAAHSLAPGHGKTMVAAYLVGERGTAWHALVLGLVVTLTHTGSAILVAIGLRSVFSDTAPADVQTALGFVGGLLIAGVGFWLFLQRLAGRSDHIHLFGGQGHAHGHSHSHGEEHGHSHGLLPAEFGRAGWVRVILLGIGGGIVPCWGAIIWLLACLSAGQIWIALPVLFAFSAGLASVLVVLGLLVVYARQGGEKRWGGRRWFRSLVESRFIRVLPAISAALVVVIGLWICRTSLRGG